MPYRYPGHPIFIVAPVGHDADAIAAVLEREKLPSRIFPDVAECVRNIDANTGALLLTEEALEVPMVPALMQALYDQPGWSELPLILLTDSGEHRRNELMALAAASPGALTVLERPMHAVTLLNAVLVALRARGRQYRLRDLAHEQQRRHRELELAIQQRQQVEARLREALDAAQAANYAKDRFLAVLSHELRTPLTPVVMTVAALELHPDVPAPLRDDLKLIRRNIELESKLIDDLLDLSRISAGKLRLHMDVLDINDLIRRVCEVCGPGIRDKQQVLQCDLAEPGAAVMGDAGRLQQVFWNLLNNAIKFTPVGGSIHISTQNTLHANGNEPHVRVTVRDTGIGISPRILPRIFDAFEQGDPPDRGGEGGLGLGLAIAKALVERHRGTISADSGAGGGSVFTVELPLLSVAQRRRLESSQQSARDHDGLHLRLLVVEDHADTARVLGNLLAKAGHSVTTARNGAQALALADSNEFDLLISDLGLPDMSGYELMRQIKSRHGIHGIAMSGYGMEEDVRRSEEAGFSDHLVKPASFAMLQQAIERVAGLRRKNQEPTHSSVVEG
jgi:signal transduction histidine kinase/ActR/RegA family two-component response regulator